MKGLQIFVGFVRKISTTQIRKVARSGSKVCDRPPGPLTSQGAMCASVLLLALPALVSCFQPGVVVAPRRAAALAASSPIFTMIETEQKAPSFLDRMRGVIVKTESKKEAEPVVEDSKSMMQKVKDAGVAGIISYIFWEWAFWGVSVPVSLFGFYEVTGHYPDFSNSEDLQKLGAEAFAFVNVARFAVPLRIGLALGTTPWVQENIVNKFQKKDA